MNKRSGRPTPDAAALSALLDRAGERFSAGHLDEAAALYRKAERLAPADFRAPYSLAVIDIQRQRLASAHRRLKGVVALKPDLFTAWHNLGSLNQELGLWDEAVHAYAQALALNADAAETRQALAAALATLGRIDEAVDQHRILAADPARRWRSLTRIAILKPQAISEAELGDIQRGAADPQLDAETRAGLDFALGEALERRGLDEGAFTAFAEGNRLKFEVLANGPAATRPAAVRQAHVAAADHVRRFFTPGVIAANTGRGSPSAAPIFIVGMPRSGSTLVEQILASHPGVVGLDETAALSRLLNGRYPEAIDPAWLRRLAAAYLEAMRGQGWTGAPRFVDKTLENYLHVGLISLMFPRAAILHTVRDPVDTCLACYRQLFAVGAETFYDLAQIGAEYVTYRQVMDHWREVLPGRIAEVSYEALLAAPEAQTRWLVTEACGLPWDPACLRFFETNRPVKTASAAQVRQPIYDTARQRWLRYERHLAPLLEALGPYAP
ncbi:MAG: sulfotransferase [Caulobacterales bacterium]